MRVEQLVSFLLLLIVGILIIKAFTNPIDSIDFIAKDEYFKDAHRDALLIYAAFISIPAIMMLLWSDKNKNFITLICWLLFITAFIMCVVILYLTYFVDPYEYGFDKYISASWYIVYALIAFIMLTILYLISKLFRIGKE